jgi:hypothetical protein
VNFSKPSIEETRIKWVYTHSVPIPEHLQSLLWDEQGYVPLEKLITRVLDYGNYDEIKYIYDTFPQETTDITFRYPHIKRGVKFWIQYWNEHRNH